MCNMFFAAQIHVANDLSRVYFELDCPTEGFSFISHLRCYAKLQLDQLHGKHANQCLQDVALVVLMMQSFFSIIDWAVAMKTLIAYCQTCFFCVTFMHG